MLSKAELRGRTPVLDPAVNEPLLDVDEKSRLLDTAVDGPGEETAVENTAFNVEVNVLLPIIYNNQRLARDMDRSNSTG